MQVENAGEKKEPLLLFIIGGHQTGGICAIAEKRDFLEVVGMTVAVTYSHREKPVGFSIITEKKRKNADC